MIRTFARNAMLSTQAPPINHHLWLLGDLNFDALGEETRKINDWASPLSGGVAGGRNGSFSTSSQTRPRTLTRAPALLPAEKRSSGTRSLLRRFRWLTLLSPTSTRA